MKILARLLIFLTTGLLFACIFAFYVKTTLQDDLDVSLSDYSLSESSIIYYEDNNGEWQELATLSGRENRIWVDLEDIPDYLVKALVSIEDRRFYEHKGVDWFRTLAAITTMFSSSDALRRLDHNAAAHQEPHRRQRGHGPTKAGGDLPGAGV